MVISNGLTSFLMDRILLRKEMPMITISLYAMKDRLLQGEEDEGPARK